MNPQPSIPGCPPPAPPETPTLSGLQQDLENLRQVLHGLLAVLIILTFGLNVFFFRQVTLARRQVHEAADYLANYQRTAEPAIQRFLTQLQDFAKTNRDFAPILTKYASLPGNPPGNLPTPPAR